MAIRNDGLVRGKHIGKGLTVDETRKKIDVDLTEFVDGESVILTGGKLKVPNKPCKRINNLNTLAGITEVGVTCITGMFNKNDAFVPGFPNIQGADVEASRAATVAEYQSTLSGFDWTGLVTATHNEVIVHISIGDQHYMSVNDAGMNTNGTLKDDTQWTPWQRVDNVPQVPQSSGLDCAAIESLPTRTWKKGTTILAKQGDECVRLTALDSLFTDVGVGIVSDKSSGFIGDEFHVTVTVTNTGEGTCPLAELVVVKPVIGSYTISDISTRSHGVSNVRETGELSYELEQLESGGTFIVAFVVVGTGHGTVQLTASVSSDTALDVSKDNNTKTLVLNVQSRQDINFVEYQDCKAVEVVDIQSGVVLPIVPSSLAGTKRRIGSDRDDRKIIVKGVNTLQGLRLKIDNVTEVAVSTRPRAYSAYHAPNVGVESVNGMNIYTNVALINNKYYGELDRYAFTFPLVNTEQGGPASIFYDINPNKDVELWRYNCIPGTDYTFENGVFELLQDSAILAIGMRTGPTCDWQFIYFVSEGNPTVTTEAPATFYTTSGNAEFLFGKQRLVSLAGYTVLDRVAKSLTVLGEYNLRDVTYLQRPHYGQLFTSATQFSVSTLISNGDTIRVRKGDHWVGGWTGEIPNAGSLGGAITVNTVQKTIEVLPTAEVGTFNFTDFVIVITED